MAPELCPFIISPMTISEVLPVGPLIEDSVTLGAEGSEVFTDS